MNYKVLLPPNIEFGIGKLGLLAEKILDFGNRILLVSGGSSFLEGSHWELVKESLENNQIDFELVRINRSRLPKLSMKLSVHLVIIILMLLLRLEAEVYLMPGKQYQPCCL
jgi:alcohol dehydrogenase YqhD (iron-dependent ADH family)